MYQLVRSISDPIADSVLSGTGPSVPPPSAPIILSVLS
jgi:hypothetical protein